MTTPQMHDARQLTRLLRAIPQLLTPLDLADINVHPTTTQPFTQQPDGKGLSISFTISTHYLAKLNSQADNAIAHLTQRPTTPK